LCLGSFRGGPTFPAIFLGGVLGVLAGHLPGLGTVPGLGICMAAGMVAILRLPVTSVLLVVLLLGRAATSQMPVVMIATVTALVVVAILDRRRGPRGDGRRAATGQGSEPDTATG
jgi:H+/Cl- antiporter ClcA